MVDPGLSFSPLKKYCYHSLILRSQNTYLYTFMHLLSCCSLFGLMSCVNHYLFLSFFYGFLIDNHRAQGLTVRHEAHFLWPGTSMVWLEGAGRAWALP